jgi:hypothetical protein
LSEYSDVIAETTEAQDTVSIPKKSAVAGVLSPDGGLRTVVTQLSYMHSHIEAGERLFIVPDFWVEEPVPWDQIPFVIHRVHQHVVRQLSPENPCGECRACCITLYINSPEFQPPKPSHSPCKWCDHTVGCLIHFNRPAVCRKFECLWLKSQKTNRIMGPELRPDRCGVMLTGPEPGDPEELFYVHPSAHDPDAMYREPMASYLKEVQTEQGQRARLVTHYRGENEE